MFVSFPAELPTGGSGWQYFDEQAEEWRACTVTVQIPVVPTAVKPQHQQTVGTTLPKSQAMPTITEGSEDHGCDATERLELQTQSIAVANTSILQQQPQWDAASNAVTAAVRQFKFSKRVDTR